MLYSVMLVSAVRHESAIFIYIYPLPLGPPFPAPSHPLGPHSTTKLSVLHSSFPQAVCLTRGSVLMPVLPSQFVSPSPSALCPYVHSPCLWLYSCPANRFISTIFKNAWTIFVFLFLACFSLYDRLSVHPHYSK